MKVRQLLCSKQLWTTGAEAHLGTGEPTFAENEQAVCWCLQGAVHKCYRHDSPLLLDVMERVHQAVLARGYDCIFEFNDAAGYDEVKSLVDRLDI